MSDVMGVNYTKANSPSPSNLNEVNDWGGKVRCQHDTYEADGLAAASTIKIAKLPKGARVLPVSKIVHDALTGTGVTLAVGDNDATPDADRYLAAVSCEAAGVKVLERITGAGHQLEQDSDIIITTGTEAATGTIESFIFYTVD
jgi:hypothetical protein